MKILSKPSLLPKSSFLPTGQKPKTVSQIIAARKEPVFDVFLGANGDAAVKVTGVPKPFQFVLPAALIRDASAFDRPTRASVMRLAQGVAREKILSAEKKVILERGELHAA